ncbi:relaxase/mobilization nuclease domain-containing protein [Nitrobacter sp. TKz-YC01]|uniref:relaxase/mobilization nuclease domain-containing protein n=1 Tax=Nitrobacter sp. TKz-YC01 TaxID=3398703 RepID=UPI003A0FCE3D
MILKASQRGSGQNLAAHLLRTDDNEHVLVHDLRGFASDDLHGAFKEAEAVSRGTKCRQYLFSLSLNPPEAECVSVGVFEEAIERIEGKLKLEGQPRAIVFHEKEGRRHAHCVWSRIDAETMTARQMSFFKQKADGRVTRSLSGTGVEDAARAGKRGGTQSHQSQPCGMAAGQEAGYRPALAQDDATTVLGALR